jgi:hypothetical protein
MIHAMVNNCQVEHESIVFETSGMIANQQFSILIYLGDIESFISSVVLKIIKVKAVEQDEFICGNGIKRQAKIWRKG